MALIIILLIFVFIFMCVMHLMMPALFDLCYSGITSFLLIMAALAVIYLPVFYYSMYRIFKKTGIPGSHAFIPCGGLWKYYRISLGHGAFMIVPIITIILAVLFQPFDSNPPLVILPYMLYILLMPISIFVPFEDFLFISNGYSAHPLLSIILLLFALGVHMVSLYKLGQKFDKSTKYCMGLAFLSPVFLVMLAHDKNEYSAYN